MPRSDAAARAAPARSCQAMTSDVPESSSTYPISGWVDIVFMVMTVTPAACRP